MKQLIIVNLLLISFCASFAQNTISKDSLKTNDSLSVKKIPKQSQNRTYP